MPLGKLLGMSAVAERFWAKVEKTEACWLWSASRNQDGYGLFSIEGRHNVAHRVAYEWLIGPIPTGLQLDHLCRVRNCVNPEHLEPVTCRENVLRGEGLAAINARLTHCSKGHPYVGENLIPKAGGGRRCRACKREWDLRWFAHHASGPNITNETSRE